MGPETFHLRQEITDRAVIEAGKIGIGLIRETRDRAHLPNRLHRHLQLPPLTDRMIDQDPTQFAGA